MVKTINYDNFVKIYKPQKNHLVKGECLYDDCMYETYGKEVEYIVDLINNKKKLNHIWTIVDCENEESWIVPGYFLVNRIGYLVTENPWESEDIQVNDNEMCTIREAVDYCIAFGEEYFKVGLDKNDVIQHFNENLDPTFDNEMTIGRAKYTAIDYFEDRLSKNRDKFFDDINDYYSQLN